jgi:hypothetical protein
MIHVRLLILALSTLALCPPQAQAQTPLTSFKGKSFDLPTPAGFCVPDSDNAFAKRITALLKNSGNVAVKIAADCKQLQANKTIYDYIAYYYPTQTEAEVLDGDIQARRKAICDELRAEQQGELSGVKESIARAAKELKQNLARSDSTKYLGVLADDAHGCYAGILSSINTGSDHFLMNVNVLTTVIHGRRFFVALYSKHVDAAQSEKMLLREETLAAELDAKNPE